MRIALYAGTFDPITRGHLSVIERGARLFDRLIVVITVNPNKQPFSVEERAEMIREVTSRWPNVECASTEGFVVDRARERGARYLVRSCTDVEGVAMILLPSGSSTLTGTGATTRYSPGAFGRAISCEASI